MMDTAAEAKYGGWLDEFLKKYGGGATVKTRQEIWVVDVRLYLEKPTVINAADLMAQIERSDVYPRVLAAVCLKSVPGEAVYKAR
jgi:hypothetical protein